MSNRTYDDVCGVARALDLVGERWALLVVRELLYGPKRFAELRRGLPGASQNVLAQRLRELEAAGVLRRRVLGPPASTSAYELTPHGAALAPALIALARWGSRLPRTATHELGVNALVLALETTFSPELAGDLRVDCELTLNGDPFRLVVADGALTVTHEPARPVDVAIAASPGAVQRVVFAGRPLAEVEAAGELTITGDRALAARLLTVFPRPHPATTPTD